VCQRLLLQLSLANPPDVEPQFDVVPGVEDDSESFVPGQALTLVMACRNVNKAKDARHSLYLFLDALLARRKTEPGYDDYGDTFRKNLKIEIEYCDLALVSSVIKCAESLRGRYVWMSCTTISIKRIRSF
jgi:3-keto steroid reductase